MKKFLIIFSFLLSLQLKGFSQDELLDIEGATDPLAAASNAIGLSQDELLDTEGAPDPQNVPVDGGISLLAAAGAAYGVSRMRKGHKSE